MILVDDIFFIIQYSDLWESLLKYILKLFKKRF